MPEYVGHRQSKLAVSHVDCLRLRFLQIFVWACGTSESADFEANRYSAWQHAKPPVASRDEVFDRREAEGYRPRSMRESSSKANRSGSPDLARRIATLQPMARQPFPMSWNNDGQLTESRDTFRDSLLMTVAT